MSMMSGRFGIVSKRLWGKGVRHRMAQGIDVAVILAFATIVGLTIILTILRYVFRTSIHGGPEIVRFCFIYTSFLGAPVLLGRREHVMVEGLVKRLPDLAYRALRICNHLLVGTLHGLLLYYSFRWISAVGYHPSDILRIPMWTIQISLQIGCGLAIFYELGHIADLLLGRKAEI
jgi:TRAP-type C4-dicarboxylate transport system permease small subunit